MLPLYFKCLGTVFICSFFCSCESKDALIEEHKELSMDSIANNYIDMFLSTDFKKRDYLLRVEKQVTFTEYNIYRISMTPYLLKNDEIPIKINQYKNMKIAFFSEFKSSDSIMKNLKNELVKQKFYRQDSLIYRFHYPEWIVIENKKNKNLQVFKDSKSGED